MAGRFGNLPGIGVAIQFERLDEFKCHPNHVNHMRQTYMTILAELADSNVGQQIIREVRGDDTYVLDKFTTNLGNAIMKGEYSLS